VEIMLRTLNLILIIFVYSSVLFGQSGSGAGDGRRKPIEADKPKPDSETLMTYLPGNWETYLTENDTVSVLFPKLPLVLEDTSNNCIGENKTNYIAYSTGKVYVLQTVKSVYSDKNCRDRKEFSAENFTNRLSALSLNATSKPVEKKTGKLKLYKVSLRSEVLWLYHDGKNDGKNDGWYELRVVNSANSNDPDSVAKNFLESFKIANNQKGTPIGKGANAIIGDKSVKTEVIIEKTPKMPSPEVKSTPIKIVFQPRANYTDAARENEINGVVRLKVIFQANGSTGSISVVSGLPYGLTEQAIVAARKIVFIPLQRDSKSITVSKTVEYRFTQY
jgi:TonB family protein